MATATRRAFGTTKDTKSTKRRKLERRKPIEPHFFVSFVVFVVSIWNCLRSPTYGGAIGGQCMGYDLYHFALFFIFGPSA
jgi:hypothetical protein